MKPAYSRKLTVELYKVKNVDHNQSLDVVLKFIKNEPLASRGRLVNQRSVRLDAIQEPTDQKPYWLMNFSSNLNRAPGQAAFDKEVSDIELPDGAVFASDAAVLYVPKTDYILIEYSQHGPRVSSIQDYLSFYLQDQDAPRIYEFQVKLKSDAEARLGKLAYHKKLSVKVAPASLTSDLRNANSSLNQALQTVTDDKDLVVEISISVMGKKKKDLSSYMPFLTRVSRDGAAKIAKVSGSVEEDGEIEEVDLIKDRERKVFNNVLLSQKGKRCSQNDRFDYLQRSYTHWVKLLDGRVI